MRNIIGLFLVISLFGCITPHGFKKHGEYVRSELVDNPEVSVNYLQSEVENFQLHYRELGVAKKAVAVWVHGTPGNWTDSAYLYRDKSFTSQVKLIMLDRPGWGLSQYKNKPRLVTSFSEISRLIQPLLNKLKKDNPDVPLILLGHSWGGSVVPTIALNNANLVDGVIVLAAGLDPELTNPRWYNRFASTYLGNALIGPGFRLANDEIYALRPELLEQHDRWMEFKQPVIVVQGKNDKLVNPKNADYAEKVLPKNTSHVLRLSNQGHLLQLEQMELIAKCIAAISENNLIACG